MGNKLHLYTNMAFKESLWTWQPCTYFRQSYAKKVFRERLKSSSVRNQPSASPFANWKTGWGSPFCAGLGAHTLTDAGALLLEYADRMLNLREEIRKSMRRLQGLKRGQVSLGVNESPSTPFFRHWRDTETSIPPFIFASTVCFRDVPRAVLSHHLDVGVISYIPEETELEAVDSTGDN